MNTSNYQELLARRTELEKQARELEAQISAARKAERSGVIAQIKSLMDQHGLTVADLGGKPGSKGGSPAKNRTVAPKYSDGTNSWTGRGLKPKWVTAAIEAGKTLESMLIK